MSAMGTDVHHREMFDSIDKVAPTILEHAAYAESEADLRPEVIAALTEHLFFRIWTPRAFGGLEVEPTTAIRIFEELARIDASVGWVVANSAVITTFIQMLPDDGHAEIYADPDSVIGGGWFPPGAASPVDGGYRLSGQWAFGSGARHAAWLTGMSVVLGSDGQPELGPDGAPLLLVHAVPADEAEVVSHWDTLGMRGTGSHDVRLDDVFVPLRRTFVMRPFDAPGSAFTGPLYTFHLWLGAAVIGAVALGAARAALDGFTTIAREKTPSYTAQVLSDRPIVHDHVARATAALGAARAYLHGALDDAYAAFESGSAPDLERLMPVQLASSYAVELAIRAVTLVQDLAGTSGIRAEGGLERHFRDVHTIAQHTLASAARYESVGQLLLGKTSDWNFFYL